jgi:hypothetical protein
LVVGEFEEIAEQVHDQALYFIIKILIAREDYRGRGRILGGGRERLLEV